MAAAATTIPASATLPMPYHVFARLHAWATGPAGGHVAVRGAGFYVTLPDEDTARAAYQRLRACGVHVQRLSGKELQVTGRDLPTLPVVAGKNGRRYIDCPACPERYEIPPEAVPGGQIDCPACPCRGIVGAAL